MWIGLNLNLGISSLPSFILSEGQSAVHWPGHEAVKVYSPSKNNATVAICLIVRNETVYMDEWMDFHIVSLPLLFV